MEPIQTCLLVSKAYWMPILENYPFAVSGFFGMKKEYAQAEPWLQRGRSQGTGMEEDKDFY